MEKQRITIVDYQRLAIRTEAPLPPYLTAHDREFPHPDDVRAFRFNHAVLGINSEWHELIEAGEQIWGKSRQIAMAEEHGDIWWYLALGFDSLNTSILIPERPAYIREVAFSKLTEIAKKILVYRKPMDASLRAEALACLGSIARWSLTKLSEEGLDHEIVLVANIAKLSERYGDKFNDFGAIEEFRDRRREFLVLEKNLGDSGKPVDSPGVTPG